MAATDAEPAGRHPGAGAWLAAHSVDLAFAAIILASFVHLLRITADAYFVGDDWKLIHQGASAEGLLHDYAGHLSVIILAAYRGLIEGFGLTYTPFRVLGLLCLLAVPVAYFVTTRRTFGPPLAAVAALALLAFGDVQVSPAALNHSLVLVGGIVCAAALDRGRRADWLVAAALAFSLAAAGGGLAVAAACVVHNLCCRASRRRWLAVLAPCAVWGVWWLIAVGGRDTELRAPGQLTLRQSLDYGRQVLWSPFAHLGLGTTVLAAVALAAFLGYGAWQLRKGLAPAASFLAWSAALGVWAAGLVYTRGPSLFGAAVEQLALPFRYQLLAFGFALLAVVPREPIAWPASLPLATDPRWLSGAAVGLLAVFWVSSTAIRDEVDAGARRMESFTATTKSTLVALDLGPSAVPDDAPLGITFLGLNAGEVRTILDDTGRRAGTTPATVDQRIVDLGGARAWDVGTRHVECEPLTEPIEWLPRRSRPLYLWSDQADWTIRVRRFGTEWVELATGQADQVVALGLAKLTLDEPWLVQADGACRVGPPAPG